MQAGWDRCSLATRNGLGGPPEAGSALDRRPGPPTTRLRRSSLHTNPAYLGRERRRRQLERRDGLPSADRALQPEDAVARVVGLFRGQRVRRLPRHRVQRDPRAGRPDRRLAALQVRAPRARCGTAGRSGDHPRRDEAQGRPGLLHALVRRGRQGRRRRHDPSLVRRPLPLDGGRPAVPLADPERGRPRGRDRGHDRVDRRPGDPGSAQPGRPRGGHGRQPGRPAATSGAGRRRSPGSRSTSAGRATPATWATSCGSLPSRPLPCGTPCSAPGGRTGSDPRG